LKLIEEGKEPSQPFYEQPEILEAAEFYWQAFNELSSDRSMGMGLGPIPYSSIRAWADEHGVTGRDDFDFFHGVIRGVDTEFLAVMNAPKDKGEMIPISDVESQHRMFARLKARAGNRK
jgi:hypothetical protein